MFLPARREPGECFCLLGVRRRRRRRRGGCRPGRLADLDLPAEVAQQVGQRGRAARRAAVLEQHAGEASLGGLVEVADHLTPPVDLVQHAHGRHPGRQVGGGAPERGVRRRPEVDEQPAAQRPHGPPGRARRARRRPPGRGRAARRRRRAGTTGSGRPAGPARTATRRRRAATWPAGVRRAGATRGRARRTGRRCRCGRRGRWRRCGAGGRGRRGRPACRPGPAPAPRRRGGPGRRGRRARPRGPGTGPGTTGRRGRAACRASGPPCPRSAAAGSARRSPYGASYPPPR